ncbi:MAG: glutamate racemase [Verrucomicrobiales bacterium]|jgi:glutamate racemase|nr:glutamate racemase [Verrucomicrobiales bacterium]
MDNRPLGVFDSGIGGLTVVRALHELLPNEQLIYLGDTARVPYGNKSAETIIRYSREISRFLRSKNVKAIIVACNTASAYALTVLRAELNIPVFGVIEPGVSAALSATHNNRVGIIGTIGTINSGAYQNRLREQNPALAITAQATPLLVPLIEEDWLEHSATRVILDEYLWPLRLAGIDTLVLACTHYPLLKPTLTNLLGHHIALVDSAQTCARFVHEALARDGLLSTADGEPPLEVYLTDLPVHFQKAGGRFLRKTLAHVSVVSVEDC